MANPDKQENSQSNPGVSTIDSYTEIDWEQLVEKNNGHLMAQGRRRGSNREDIDDAIQETYLELFRNKHKITEINVAGLIFTVNSHKFHDQVRRRKSRPSSSLDQVKDVKAWEPSDGQFEQEVIDRDYARRTIGGVITRINPEQLQALNAKGAGLTDQEASRALGIPLGTYKTRVRLGRKQASRILQPK